MPLRTNGGIIGPTNTPSAGSAKGRWTLPEQYKAVKGASWPGQAISATGGTVTSITGYTVHTYTTSNPFVVNSGAGNLEMIVIAGGGGGGCYGGGGGGAGGFVDLSTYPITPGTYPVVIGAGGGPVGPGNSLGITGQDSSFTAPYATVFAAGGGGGGIVSTLGRDGGSGGGHGSQQGSPNNAVQPVQSGVSGTFGYGFRGGAGWQPTFSGSGGGGGGAGGIGASPVNETGSGAPGGAGRTSSINGSPVCRAGGGSGYGNNQTATATCGGGGGINGSGSANTGGGGAGVFSGNPFASGSGGSGIVIIRYPS